MKWFTAFLVTMALAPGSQASPQKSVSRQEDPMADEAVIASLRAHDRNVLRRPPQAPPNLASALEPALRGFDEDSRSLTVSYLKQYNAPGTGNLLLRLSGDSSANVSSAAAQTLVNSADTPPGETILATIPARQDSFVRGQLYLAAGNAKTPPGLDIFRSLAAKEHDPDAAELAQAAIVKLGGDVERKAFIKRIETTPPDKALRVQDQILYVGDPKLAKALGPWFANKEGVMRMGSDRQGMEMIRMCDIAVWIAHRLGVRFAMQPADHLTRYEASVLMAAKAAAAALPD